MVPIWVTVPSAARLCAVKVPRSALVPFSSVSGIVDWKSNETTPADWLTCTSAGPSAGEEAAVCDITRPEGTLTISSACHSPIAPQSRLCAGLNTPAMLPTVIGVLAPYFAASAL